MAGLFLELQSDALNRDVRVADLLRKAMVVSKKLGIPEIEQWIARELGGYTDYASIPEYRKVRGEVQVRNPYHGWQPLHIENEKIADIVSTTKIGQPISELDSIAQAEGAGSLQSPLTTKQITWLMKAMEVPLPPTLMLSPTVVIGILDAVRNNILDWALELEKKGVVGEGMSFSKEEKSVASQVTYQTTNYIGAMSNSQLQQHASGSSQVISQSLDVEALEQLVNAIEAKVRESPPDERLRAELTAELQTLRAQANSPKPKVSIIRESLKSTRRILEEAAGHILASDVGTKITGILQSLS